MSAQPWEARLAHLEGAFVQVGDRLNTIDRRIESLEDRMESRFSRLEATLEARFGQIDQRFMWLIGIVVATWITTMLTLIFHHQP